MAMLHEILAVEKTRIEAANALIEDTKNKFGKDHYFYGHEKVLEMLTESPENAAMELAARESRELPTTVFDTLDYAVAEIWVAAEDVIFQKNLTNTKALADIVIDGRTIAVDIPVDELMGLENRLDKLRSVLMLMPTLEASMKWVPAPDRGAHVWECENEQTASKTEKYMVPVVLYDATKEHPAQVKEVGKDEVVGTFKRKLWSGAATTRQKADVLKRMDDLISAVKAARMRANKTEVIEAKIGEVIARLILEPLS